VLPVRRRRRGAADGAADAADPVVQLARPGLAPEAAPRHAGVGWMGGWLASGDTPPRAQDWHIRL
jgi:hypothetical protein